MTHRANIYQNWNTALAMHWLDARGRTPILWSCITHIPSHLPKYIFQNHFYYSHYIQSMEESICCLKMYKGVLPSELLQIDKWNKFCPRLNVRTNMHIFNTPTPTAAVYARVPVCIHTLSPSPPSNHMVISPSLLNRICTWIRKSKWK